MTDEDDTEPTDEEIAETVYLMGDQRLYPLSIHDLCGIGLTMFGNIVGSVAQGLHQASKEFYIAGEFRRNEEARFARLAERQRMIDELEIITKGDKQ